MYNILHSYRIAVSVFIAFALLLFGATAALAKAEKVSVCHATGSEHTPVVVISVSEHALDAHLAHGDQLFNDDTGLCGDDDGGPDPV